MLANYRSSDAVIIVRQNNDSEQIEIAAMNPRARELSGWADEEIVGKSLGNFVSPRIAELLGDYVEYKANRTDVGDVLGKVHDFHLRSAAGSLLPFRLRIVRAEVVDRYPLFHLVLRDEQLIREDEAFRIALHESFKGHEVLDETTELPNRATLLKDIELVQTHGSTADFSACFAVMEIDRVDELTADLTESVRTVLLKHVGQICRQRLRGEDIVGVMSDHALGLILMQITPEAARIVLNRLRWAVSAMPVILPGNKKITLTVSVGFATVDSGQPPELFRQCEEQTSQLRTSGGNGIQLVKAA